MQKPADYDTVQAANIGEYEVLEPGGYICKIMKAEIKKSSKGDEMLEISFDIAEGDKKGFYARKYKDDTRDNKKWQGMYRQLTGGNGTKFFKGLIKAIEESNAGYKFDFDEKKLAGKLFGGIFGREEWFNTYKGEYQFFTKLAWVRSVETIKKGGFNLPPDKLANRGETPLVDGGKGFPDGFYAGEALDEDDLPF